MTVKGEGNDNPLQYSCLENPMDGGASWAAVHGVARSRTWLSDFTFTLHFHELEKEMATYSSVLAWRIPGTGEPGGLPSMGSHRVGHNWRDLAAAVTVKTLIPQMIPTTSSLKREKPPPHSDVVSEKPCNTIEVFSAVCRQSKIWQCFSVLITYKDVYLYY